MHANMHLGAGKINAQRAWGGSAESCQNPKFEGVEISRGSDCFGMAARKSCVCFRQMILFLLGVVIQTRSQTPQSLHHSGRKRQLMSKVDVDPSSAYRYPVTHATSNLEYVLLCCKSLFAYTSSHPSKVSDRFLPLQIQNDRKSP